MLPRALSCAMNHIEWRSRGRSIALNVLDGTRPYARSIIPWTLCIAPAFMKQIEVEVGEVHGSPPAEGRPLASRIRPMPRRDIIRHRALHDTQNKNRTPEKQKPDTGKTETGHHRSPKIPSKGSP